MTRRPLIELLAQRDPPIEDPSTALADFRVTVDGVVVTNPESRVRSDARIVVKAHRDPRGVAKLGHALDAFDVTVAGALAVDLGACTGGFTIALLGRGAARVFAVDVGFGQLLGSLQQDERVVNLERTNVGDVTPQLLGGQPDLVVVDVTKLKLGEVAAQVAANGVPRPGTELVGLVKPMFELGLGELPTAGGDLARALGCAVDGIEGAGWNVVETIESSMRGHRGAVEFFVHARWP